MNRRSLLTALLALPMLARPSLAESAGTVTLYANGQQHRLTIDPATLGYRSAWQDYGDSVSFGFDAEGPGGTYSVSGDAAGTDVTYAILFAPGLPGLGNAGDSAMRLTRVRRQGYQLAVQGEITGAGLRIAFDVVLPTMNFAPTPGPDPRP